MGRCLSSTCKFCFIQWKLTSNFGIQNKSESEETQSISSSNDENDPDEYDIEAENDDPQTADDGTENGGISLMDELTEADTAEADDPITALPESEQDVVSHALQVADDKEHTKEVIVEEEEDEEDTIFSRDILPCFEQVSSRFTKHFITTHYQTL